jgi:hypothetical protein
MGIGDIVTSVINHGTKSTAGLIINKFDFYSGSQIGVWFDTIYLDDINSIQWTRQQSKKPLYGYASQLFDSVANGTVLISGNFTVNFRQSGYLASVMGAIKHLYNSTSNKENWPALRNIIDAHMKNGTFGPKTITELQDLGSSPDFIELSKAYEDIVWGPGVPLGDQPGRNTPQSVRDASERSYNEDSNRRRPSDIAQSYDAPDGFNITITYGNNATNQPNSISDYLQSTSKSLNGVHLLGESQIIQVGGQPAMEQYEFIARNTDETI